MLKTIYFIVTSLLIFTSSFAFGNVSESEFYGKFDISIQKNSNYNSLSQNSMSRPYTQSNGSRVGIKMYQQSVNSFSIVGQLEYAVDFNTNRSNDIYFSNRNTYVGISNLWGKILIGRHDTPLKLAQGNIDLFSDSDSQMWPLQRGENRVSDTLMFRSSNFNYFSLDFALVNNANQAVNGSGFSLAFKYQNNDTYMALAIDKDILDYDVIRWVGSYSLENMTVSALLQQSTSTKTKLSKEGYTLSASYQYSEYLLKMQFTHSDEIIEDGSYMTVGVDWQLTDDLLLYTFYTDRSFSQKEELGDLVSIGIKYKF